MHVFTHLKHLGAVVSGEHHDGIVGDAEIVELLSLVPDDGACSAVIVNGITFQQCGTTWYQPQFAGTSVTYVVVNAPR